MAVINILIIFIHFLRHPGNSIDNYAPFTKKICKNINVQYAVIFMTRKQVI